MYIHPHVVQCVHCVSRVEVFWYFIYFHFSGAQNICFNYQLENKYQPTACEKAPDHCYHESVITLEAN